MASLDQIVVKFEDVIYRVQKSETSPNPLKQLASEIRSRISSHQPEYAQILSDLTGNVRPGEILALLGPVGGGKTSLLNILSGRVRIGVEGLISYNDMPYTNDMQKRIGFITQDDVLFPQLTVQETLVFTGLLRLPNNIRKTQKYQRAAMIIDELGLRRCRDRIVGGISGGEKKLLSIAQEVLIGPSLLLLDEPTSGLDSSSSDHIMQVLRRVARTNRTVIMSIDKPTNKAFYMLDKVLLLSPNGHQLHFGTGSGAVGMFTCIGFEPPVTLNPAEYLLDLVNGKVNNWVVPADIVAAPTSRNYENDIVNYLECKFKNDMLALVREQITAGPSGDSVLRSAIQVTQNWTINWWQQFKILCQRTIRERRLTYIDPLRFLQTMLFAIVVGIFWWRSKADTESQLRDQIGLLYYICLFWTFSSVLEAVYIFPYEKSYLVKAYYANMYHISAFYVSSTLCDMVARVVHPVIFTLITYFMISLEPTTGAFFTMLLAVLLISVCAQGASELFGAAIMGVRKAGLIASMGLLFLVLTGGYYIQHIPSYVIWTKYVSFLYHGFQLLLKIQYGVEFYDCDGTRCKALQDSPSFETVDLSRGLVAEISVLIGMAVLFRVCAYLCLRLKIKRA